MSDAYKMTDSDAFTKTGEKRHERDILDHTSVCHASFSGPGTVPSPLPESALYWQGALQGSISSQRDLLISPQQALQPAQLDLGQWPSYDC
jgi:hypothetical protein